MVLYKDRNNLNMWLILNHYFAIILNKKMVLLILVCKISLMPSHSLYSLKGRHTHNLIVSSCAQGPLGKQGCGGNYDKTRYFSFVKQKSSIKIVVEPKKIKVPKQTCYSGTLEYVNVSYNLT
jgi:hypothetical protein